MQDFEAIPEKNYEKLERAKIHPNAETVTAQKV